MINWDKNYLEKFWKIIRWTPEGLINNWKILIDIFYNGYDFSTSELMNDLGDREMIEEVLSNKELSTFPDHQKFIAEINELDELFKKITIEDPDPTSEFWFQNRINKIHHL